MIDEVKEMGAHGITFGAPADRPRAAPGFKNGVVSKLTGGLGAMAKLRKVEVVRGIGRFVDAHHLRVELTAGTGKGTTGASKLLRFEKAIIAAGSEAMKLPFMPEDPRIVDSTGALELDAIPKRMLVVGGGIIGLEMANVYSTLGARIDVVEMLDGVMMGADRDLVKVWEKKNAGRFDQRDAEDEDGLGDATAPEGIHVGFRRREGSAEPQVYDLVLVAVGRRPNGRRDRRGQGRRRGDRARLHHGRRPDAHAMSRTSSRSATSSVNRCSRTRRCTRGTSRRRQRRG